MSNAFMSLVSRHNKVFRRDRSLVFFSFLSVIIVLILYVIFIQKTQVEAIEQVVPASSTIPTMVNEWMVAGLLSIISVTTTLAAFSIFIKDAETKILADFLTTPLSRVKIQLSYIVNAWIVGYVLSLFAFVICEIFIVSMGGEWLSIKNILKIIGILALTVTLSSTMNLLFTLLAKSQNAFSALNTIVGTAIGFLCGVYVPMVALPAFVQKIIMVFPISHTTVIMRDIFTNDSITKVFKGSTTAAETYRLNFGIMYEFNGDIISHSASLIFIIVSTILLALLSLGLFARKNK